MRLPSFLPIVVLFFALTTITAQERTKTYDQDEELGKVSWYRDYDTALDLAKKEGKPVLILFQEVPGCATCRNYGHNVLSHPLMTEAIENEFIPLAIFNNKGGKDRQILKKYKEPSWNNPVVRIVNDKGENLVRRVASDYSAKGLYNAMINALEAYGNPIPEYVKILGKELTTTTDHNLQEKHFKMYCFWTGEKKLGSQDGVLATQAGFMNRSEVVRVIYDADEISEQELSDYAQANSMIPVAKTQFQWSPRDEDYFIQHSRFKHVPLTEVQKTKINSALGLKQNPQKYLSPKQLEWFKHPKTKESIFDQDFFESWDKLSMLN
ncbi:VPGUxxT family thioredoxin-like (seleno)protein, type 2 [Aureisphaera galaxeae]|uniref:VPGUxxT family thioredoxin-like (seleno)protein, type 2 n=1 Tax=Aureisphaera galaxeae TaxID=1538023 RepID=UPI002350BD2D|nr:VPGUxxT family thioredoxin-like (seleno)protein, type 2 [Aureisphaera galaxeae]MDC8003600.1 VPGUxxT family thioredoxin-like (seleno)protein, type 2 [Aureisphaera galaxeae]